MMPFLKYAEISFAHPEKPDLFLTSKITMSYCTAFLTLNGVNDLCLVPEHCGTH
jgi:hypothetical protein